MYLSAYGAHIKNHKNKNDNNNNSSSGSRVTSAKKCTSNAPGSHKVPSKKRSQHMRHMADLQTDREREGLEGRELNKVSLQVCASVAVPTVLGNVTRIDFS